MTLCLMALTLTAAAAEWTPSTETKEWTPSAATEELRLTKPAMQPRLTYGETDTYRPQPSLNLFSSEQSTASTNKWTWMRTNPGVQPYKVMDDLTFVGVPLFVAGIIAKGEKKYFAQQYQNTHSNTRLVTNFKSSIDDYSQYFGPAMTLGLKLGGVEGRSDWGRFLGSAALSYGIMATIVNGIKYTAKEMRPDGTQANSWPSGHTATSFVGATILHKEYGLTVSPWYSIAGYGVATATGVMRVLNNRHWVSDILSGAGVGIMSTEIAYALSDVLFKGKGLLRNDLEGLTNASTHPSFFSISMGVGLGSKSLDFEALSDDKEPIKLSFQTATAVQAEGAYFLNKYVGIGGRLRVKTSPIKGWESFMSIALDDAAETLKDLQEMQNDPLMPLSVVDKNGNPSTMTNLLLDKEFSIESDHLTEFAADAGLYFNIPLSDRFSLGTKLLIGRSIMQELDINARYAGNKMDMDYNMTIQNGYITNASINRVIDTGEPYEQEWDYLTVSADNSTKYGTGLSLTYAYKKNFSWKVFCDYDYTKKDYNLNYNPDSYLMTAMPDIVAMASLMGEDSFFGEQHTIRKHVNSWVIGASFAVSF